MKRIKNSLLVVLALTLGVTNANANAEKPIYEIHSMMVYNFAKYINWPSNTSAGNFVIAVMGDDEVYNTMKGWYENKVIGSQKIVVKKFNSPNEIQDCHVLYVGDEQASHFSTIKSYVTGKSTLIITNKSGLGKMGSMINFVEIEGKMRFELNQRAATTANLQISSQLVGMAILI